MIFWEESARAQPIRALRFWACGIALGAGFAAQAAASRNAATEPRIVSLSTSLSGQGTLATVFKESGGPAEDRPVFSTAASEQLLKISIGFDPPLFASRTTLESCKGAFEDGIEFAAAPGFTRFFAEAGFAKATAKMAAETNGMRSLAIGFRHNRGVCLSAIRFEDAKGVAIKVAIEPDLAVSAPASETQNRLRAAFLGAGLPDVLDEELVAQAEDEKWVFRFRSDSSVFVYGVIENPKGPGRFSTVGIFEVVDSKKNKISLLVRARRFTTAHPWDGSSCVSACGDRELAESVQVDTIVVEKVAGGYMIRNRDAPKRRAIPFSDVRVRKSSLSD